MLLLLAKKLIPAPIAAGLVGMTVLLANSRKNSPQTSLWPRFTSSDIDEKEIHPEALATTPAPSEIQEEERMDNKPSGEESGEESDTPQNQLRSPQEKLPESREQPESPPEIQSQESSSSLFEFFGAEPPDPKMIMLEIVAKQPVWVSAEPSLNSIYEMNSRIDGLLSALERLKSQQK